METSAQTEATDWVQQQVERHTQVCEKYKLYADVLAKVLACAARKLAPLAIVQTRTKSLPSFAEKIVRKRHLYDDPLCDMTDLCGGRVITLTADQVHAVGRFLEEHFEIDWENSDDVSQRLRPTEFGYRSVHYIVSFKPGVFPTPDVPVEIPDCLYGNPAEGSPPLKAEIQVRTILEHAWADISHDLIYKSGFRVPTRLLREVAAIAAVLEGADREFARIHDSLRAYASDYGKYLDEQQLRQEIAKLELVLKHDSRNVELVNRIAGLAMALGDWQKAIDTLRPYVATGHRPLLRNLGIALCRAHVERPGSDGFREGRELLQEATNSPHADPEGLCALAETFRTDDEDRARELYRQAVELDPTQPTCLINHLQYEIAWHRNRDIVRLMVPTIRGAMGRCRQQIEAGVDLARAYLHLAGFHLLLEDPHASLAALAKAIQLPAPPFMLQSAYDSLSRVKAISAELSGYEWIRRLLLLGQTAKYPAECRTAHAAVRALATPQLPPIRGPVVIVAGGCDPSVERQMQGYGELLVEAFRGFSGTIFSGGTTQGVSGLVGDMRKTLGTQLRTVGYVPKLVPADATVDHDPHRYDEIRYTSGSNFSPLEPLQNWIDLLASGIASAEVRVLGINGGPIAAAEYRIAAALGARVAIVENSGRAAARVFADSDWENVPNIVRLPSDAMTIRAFLGAAPTNLDEGTNETIAKGIHAAYRRNKNKTHAADPALSEWDRLPETLQNSNRQQARHVFEKLREIDCSVRPRHADEDSAFEFTADEIERLAEVEHGRWTVERLFDGWRYGETKDVNRKISPYLVPWTELTDEVQEWDRAAVREIPTLLAEVGLRIVRNGSPEAA